MKKIMMLLVLVVVTGTVFGQNVVDISYNNLDDEMHLCVADSLNLETIMTGQWSGPGIVNNVFYSKNIPAGETVKLVCGKKEFLVYVQDIPYVSMGWMPKEIKVGSGPIQLTAYPQGGKWYMDGTPFDGTFIPKEIGTREIIYVLTDTYGCTAAAATYVQVK